MQNLVGCALSRAVRRSVCRCMYSTSGPDGGVQNTGLEQDKPELFETFKKAILNHPKLASRGRVCKTTQNDPTTHTIKQEGLFYTVDENDAARWMKEGLMPNFYNITRAFNETCIMVRKPAVEIIECMRAANYDHPVIRYVLYGGLGCGKSTTMAHLMHFCGKQDWLIVHVPWAALLHRYSKEVTPSTYKKGRMDQPLDAAQWITRFINMNSPLLKDLDLQTTAEYTWSKREITNENSSFLQMLDFGLGRVKYASDVVGAAIKELKQQASAGKFRLLVAIEAVNAFWEESAYIREESRHKYHHAQELAMVQHLTKLVKNDWNGGAVICTVDEKASINYANCSSHMPRFLLGKEGFELFDPFIPVHVPKYSDKEAHSCIDYFIDRKWIQNPIGLTNGGRKEMIFLSSKNPWELYKVSRRW